MPAFGVKAILLAAAVVFFVIALIGDIDDAVSTWMPLGLAVFAGAFLVEILGFDRRVR